MGGAEEGGQNYWGRGTTGVLSFFFCRFGLGTFRVKGGGKCAQVGTLSTHNGTGRSRDLVTILIC